MTKKPSSYQMYPRIAVGHQGEGLLDTAYLQEHTLKIALEEIREMIKSAIRRANVRSSRAILSMNFDAEPSEIEKIYKKAGTDLFAYFRKYSADPAATAHQIHGEHYKKVAEEQFRLKTLQKERMNSAWRYQFFVVECAAKTGRFKNISDVGTAEADFNATISFKDGNSLNLYVSVKNRSNTLGGQDWPKAIQALEQVAALDMNKTNPYLCVFGITMDRGQRYRKIEKKTGRLYSENTEIWLSDFFWPFFTNFSYEEIMMFFLEVLMDTKEADPLVAEMFVPDQVMETFGEECRRVRLVNEQGIFDNPQQLVRFFCGSLGKQQVEEENPNE